MNALDNLFINALPKMSFFKMPVATMVIVAQMMDGELLDVPSAY